MNRRDFGKLIAGSGVAAALPIPGAAAASAQRSKYIFAVALAHARTDVSVEMISETFNIRPGTARQLLAKLVRNGVVDKPNASGIARLAEPLQRIVPQVVEYNPAGGYVVRGRLDDLTAKAKDVAKRLLDDADDGAAPEIAEGEETPPDAAIVPDPPIVQNEGSKCTNGTGSKG